MGKKWDEHWILTGVTKEMKDALPKGLKCVDNKIKVPEWPHKLNDKYYEWCVKFGIGNGVWTHL